MATKEMLMTEALRERKLLKDRFNKTVREGVFVGTIQGENKTPMNRQFKDNESLASKIESSRQSSEALLSNYRRLVAAIIKSNAETFVDIKGQRMSVAEAVEYRNSISMERLYLNALKVQLAGAITETNRTQSDLDADIERRVSNMKTESMSADDVMKLLEDTKNRFYVELKPEVFDPTKVSDRIEELERILQDFDVELETSLNISNATTPISVEYV